MGGCEVHPLPDGRFAMFYIGYSDIDTARIGCAVSPDGVTGWRRLPQNPLVAPDLHAHPSAEGRRAFDFLMWQYAAQQKRTRGRDDGWTVQPWIDENLNPDKPEWLSREIILANPEMRAKFPKERGKDYNHSSFCDLVITGIVGFTPDGKGGFTVNPLADPSWDWFTLENLRWRGHDIDIRYLRGEGLTVTVDGETM